MMLKTLIRLLLFVSSTASFIAKLLQNYDRQEPPMKGKRITVRFSRE